MRLKIVAMASAAACIATTASVAPTPADAQQRYANRNTTTVVSRDETGRTRTRVIVEKRSYLDPGTEVLPGSRHDRDFAMTPNHRADGILNNTVAGGNQTALPGPWELGARGPWIRF